MPAEIYQVWAYPDGRQSIVSRKGGERLAEQRRRMRFPPTQGPRLVNEFVACSYKDAVAFHRRIERSRNQRRDDD